jgi:hypothetical protein
MVALATLVHFSASAKEYKGNKFKGTIESVTNDKLTLRDEAEETMEFFVVPKTEIARNEKPADLEDLQPDDVAIITAARENGRMVALRVFVMEPQ